MTEDNVRAMWSEDELDTALAALRSEVDTDDRALARSRAELLVAAGPPTPAEPVEPPVAAPRRRRWSWWAAAAATVVLVVAGALVVQNVRFDDHQPVAQAAAAKELNLAADKIGASDEPVGPGQYRYIATHAWWMATIAHDQTYSYLAENLLETWVPAEEKQEWLWRRKVTGERKWVQGTEAQARAAGIPIDQSGWPEGEWRAPCGDWFAKESGREPCTQEGGWQQPDEAFMASLPRDPDELYDVLRDATEGRGKTPDLEMLVYPADILRSGLVPADLRAALYRVLAKVPDIEVTEEAANLDGRKGIAFGVTGAGTRHEVIIDRATGQFIGERQIAVDGNQGIPAGTVMSYTSVSTAAVDEMGQQPTG